MSKAEDRAMAIIHALARPISGFAWLDMCKSPTAFLKTWPLGRAGRRLAILAAKNKKTAARDSGGQIVARHALIAIAKMAKQIKSRGGQGVHYFVSFVIMLGLWAARAAAEVLRGVPLVRQRKLNVDQEFQFPF